MAVVFETFVTMDPVAKGRPRSTKGGHMYTPTKTVQAEHRIQEQVGREWAKPPLEGPVSFTLVVYLVRPKNAKNKPYPLSRPDGDNYLKLAADSLNRVMWKDDSIIVNALVQKRFVTDERPHPGFYIIVEDLS
jgi:Holliday junction resolvase RusA-like endonuclease